MSEIAVTELGYVGLGVGDLSRRRVLAGEVLGMECVEAGDNLHLRMDYWNYRIRLHPDAPSITVSVAPPLGGEAISDFAIFNIPICYLC